MEEKSYSPGLEGVIAAETRISFLDVEREEIVIRGYNLLELIRRRSYVDVVGCWWRSSFPRRRGERSWRGSLWGCGAPGRL
jgi:citrate synthase